MDTENLKEEAQKTVSGVRDAVRESDLGNEAKNTVNQVKDSFKNVNINQEAKETHGFVKEMLSSPFRKLERIANGEEDAFKKSVMLLLIDIITSVVVSLIFVTKYSYVSIGKKVIDLILAGVSPIASILVPAIIILLMNKSNKKPLTTIISTLVVASIPSIIAGIIDIIENIFVKILLLTSPISTALYALTIVFSFYGMKKLLGEEDEEFFGKFILIKFITALVLYVI